MAAFAVIILLTGIFALLIPRTYHIAADSGLSLYELKIDTLWRLLGIEVRFSNSEMEFFFVAMGKPHAIANKSDSEKKIKVKKNRPRKKRKKKIDVICLFRRFSGQLHRFTRIFSITGGEGNCIFGLGDPARTGVIWGWIQAALAVLPIPLELSVAPDFLNQRLAGRCRISGRIYFGRLILIMIGLILKMLRCLIRPQGPAIPLSI